MTEYPGEISELLSQWRGGSADAEERLLSLVYPRLRAIAARHLPDNPRPVTLQTSDLVNEVYLRLVGQERTDWKNRAHFFSIAARLMRRIVLDEARRRRRDKRGGGAIRLSLEEVSEERRTPAVDWLELDRALQELAVIDPTCEQIVELRFFAGMTVEEVAEVLGVSDSTVKRSWRFARAWLRDRLRTGGRW